MKAGRVFAVLIAAGLVHGAANAGEDIQARNWAATCTGCHGTNGKSEGAIPSIAGLPESEIVRLMREFKENKRAATVMHQLAKGYTDAQIQRIAAYFAAKK